MRMLRTVTVIFTLLALHACGNPEPSQTETTPPADTTAPAALPSSEISVAAPASSLTAALAAQPAETQARYMYRHPQETLDFFGVEPGMTVLEALPGGGRYSKILLNYLGPDGQLVGVNYAPDLWPNFSFATEEYLARIADWTTTWSSSAEEWRDENSAPVQAFVFGQIDPALNDSVDAVLMIRALHNMARFSEHRAFLQEAIENSFTVLKPGGILGIVQHEARAEMPDEWATGAAGYLKRSFVIEQITAAGFEFVGASEVNQNPQDQPTSEDIVWRLPPSLNGSQDDAALAAQMRQIGESNRMTLKFRKPA